MLGRNTLKFILFAIFNIFFISNKISEVNSSEIINQTSNKYTYEESYILGPGDSLEIQFISLVQYSGIYEIENDGYLFLPEIGYFFTEGKTLKEIRDTLNEKYKEFIIDPELKISIFNHKTLNVSLRGEVNRPGLYKLNYGLESPNNIQVKTYNQNNITIKSPPRLFDLIKLGTGITSKADLSNITIVRVNPKIYGGGKLKAKVDLLSLLRDGDQSQNITLRDGDDVIVNKSEKVLIDQLTNINKSNLTPDTIEVYINGNIPRPGRIQLKQGLSLFEGIAAVGGKNSLSGNIEFIRLSNNGVSQKRIIRFNQNASKGSMDNPILVNGDMVHVRKNFIGKTGTIIKDYSTPIINSYGLYKIFD